jgi:hypothetical protein
MVQQALVGQGLLIIRFHDHNQTHPILKDSTKAMDPSRRHLPYNIHHAQQTNIHTTGGIRTHNANQQAVADQRLRPRGRWDD